jgi:hypothetical protein
LRAEIALGNDLSPRHKNRRSYTVSVEQEEGRTMGFQSADLVELGRALLRFDGVSGVWLLRPSDQDAVMWVEVNGFDQAAHQNRIAVRSRIETFIAEAAGDMKLSGFVFDYFVLVADDELGESQIPSGAIRIAA